MIRKIPTYIQILIGMALGITWGFFAPLIGVPDDFTMKFIKPFGSIFINLLKMISIPLVFASLIIGITDLNSIQKLSSMGKKTIGLYMLTTLLALVVGIVLVNIVQPGKLFNPEVTQEILGSADTNLSTDLADKINTTKSSPLQPLIDIFPTNIFSAAMDNQKTLQVVFLALFIGIVCIQLPKEKTSTFVGFINNLNEIVIKMIEYIMIIAPIGVFALISAIIIDINDPSLLWALFKYSLTVLGGLLIMTVVVYPLMLKIFTNMSFKKFYNGIRPAQLLAFSTSSSSATLPLTMKRCEENLGIHKDVTSFVLPMGATINMDGTSLYQAVAAVFIAQVAQIDLTLLDQIKIILTALLASIGTAGVPGVGIILLAIVLESVGLPVAYIALILAPDRILDMCRTAVNITGDATVASIVNQSLDIKKAED